MQTIRILFYTDTHAMIVQNGQGDEGSSILQRLIKEKLKGIVNVEIAVKNRHFDETSNVLAHGATRLTKTLLNDFDELWMFGFDYKENTQQEPARELTAQEVNDLCVWMNTGGVMVTGDHSQPQGNQQCGGPEQHADFLARGFSLGHKIPRAGQMRAWKGPPTNCAVDPSQLSLSDTHNTLAKGDSADEETLQSDHFAQLLEEIQPPPHSLFFYGLDANQRPVQIRSFPDHQHEGRVLIPQTYDKFWPPRPPLPEVVARGRDQRFPTSPRVYDLFVAYDGDPARVGRIAADTSFHHFINLNLKMLPGMNAACGLVLGTPLDEIAQFYANLAYWLAPVKIRDCVRKELFFRAATHIIVLEALGNSTFYLGKAAKAALASEVGTANVWRILSAGYNQGQQQPEQFIDYALTGRGAPEQFGGMGQEYLLGAMVESYHDFFRDKELDPLNLLEDPTTPGFLLTGLERAFSAQLSLAERLASKFTSESNASPGGGAAPPQEPPDVCGDVGEH